MDLYHSNTYQADLEAACASAVGLAKLKNTSILITGAAGLIGSFLVDMLLACNRRTRAGIRIYAMGRSLERLKQRFDPVKTEDLIYVEQDVCQPLTAMSEPVDYIIHAANNAHPASFTPDPVGTVMSNVQGTYQLLRYGTEHGVKRLLFVSSGEVYGQCDDRTAAFHEDYSGYVDPMQLRSCYPVSKRAAETLCVSYSAQFGLDTVIARPCHTYGPNVTAEDNRATVQFLEQAAKGQDIVVNSTGKQLRSYCYIADCASAILTILLQGASAQAYNISHPEATITIGGFAAVVASQTGQRVVFSHPEKIVLSEKVTTVRQVLSSQKLQQLGWKGCYDVETGVAHTLSILREAR